MPFGVASALAIVGIITQDDNTSWDQKAALQQAANLIPQMLANPGVPFLGQAGPESPPLSRVVVLDLDDAGEIMEPAVIGRAIDLENP